MKETAIEKKTNPPERREKLRKNRRILSDIYKLLLLYGRRVGEKEQKFCQSKPDYNYIHIQIYIHLYTNVLVYDVFGMGIFWGNFFK